MHISENEKSASIRTIQCVNYWLRTSAVGTCRVCNQKDNAMKPCVMNGIQLNRKKHQQYDSICLAFDSGKNQATMSITRTRGKTVEGMLSISLVQSRQNSHSEQSSNTIEAEQS